MQIGSFESCACNLHSNGSVSLGVSFSPSNPFAWSCNDCRYRSDSVSFAPMQDAEKYLRSSNLTKIKFILSVKKKKYAQIVSYASSFFFLEINSIHLKSNRGLRFLKFSSSFTTRRHHRQGNALVDRRDLHIRTDSHLRDEDAVPAQELDLVEGRGK